jgi:hypothetical protein
LTVYAFLDHAAHQVRGIDLVHAVAELAVEAVGIEQREEKLEILFLAVVRRCRHQQQVADMRAELLGKAEPPRFLQLRAEVVGGELVGLVKDGEVPARRAEFVLELFVAGELVEPNDQPREVLERIAARRGLIEQRGIDVKLQPELLVKLIVPLLDQAARRDDHDAVRIRAHDELADVKAGHDGLACAGIIRQHEAQRLAREKGLINGSDLMWQRLDVRAVHRHHGVKEKGEVDPLGLAGKLKGRAVAVKGERALGSGDPDRCLVITREQALLDRALGGPVDELERSLTVRDSRHDRNDLAGLDARQALPCGDVFEFHAIEPAFFL